MMKIQDVSKAARPARADLIVGLAYDGLPPKLGSELADAVKEARATGDLRTGFRKVSSFHPRGKSAPKRIAFVGMGKRGELTTERLRRAAALAQQVAEQTEVATFRLVVDDDVAKRLGTEAAARAVAEGLVLGAYQYEPPRKEKPKARKGQKAQVQWLGGDAKAVTEGLKIGRIGAEATVFARDLENMPGNLCTPKHLAAQARKLAGPGVKVKVLQRRDMERLKMGALLGVAKGSNEPPALIVLDHNPQGGSKGGSKRTLCVVGKGLTFDSGGISIKPSSKMDEMRYDMCGGGAVLGLFHAIRNGGMSGGAKVRVVGIVAAAENMPDAGAQKPGDVVRAMNGTTIEVLNTDAEGRLVLADALAYAREEYEPDSMVDLATLTGAVVVALGHEMAGVMGTDEDLIESLIEAGKAVDEPLWELPLWEVHREQVKSKFADVANINSPGHGNGSTAGGAFLSYFVGDTPWAHMDIAGAAWGGISKDYYRGGAAGTAVRTLLQWVRTGK